MKEGKLLVHIVSEEGIKIVSNIIEAINNIHLPTTTKKDSIIFR
jgi:hypothetical protein